MAKYVNITTSSSTTLLTKNTQYTGNISSMRISNNDSSSVEVSVSLYDGTDHFYLVRDLVIPGNTSLKLDDDLSFNIKNYDLIISHDTNPNLTIIIK
jgi:hypothetical protein